MSDYIVKIIPKDSKFRITSSIAHKAADVLKDAMRAQQAEVNVYESPQFIDCGSNLESIHCPACGSLLDFDWWGEQMGVVAGEDFTSLEVELPCCGETASLNDLRYHFPCGFACTEFAFWNPEKDPSAEDMAQLEEQLGTPVRVIRAHL